MRLRNESYCLWLALAAAAASGSLAIAQGTGACQLDPGGPLGASCLITTADECAAFGGKYHGDDSECPPADGRGEPTGACVVPEGGGLASFCFIGTETTCEAFSGLYLGDDSECPPPPDDLGSCTVTSGDTTACFEATEGECAKAGGEFGGIGVPCNPFDPPPPPIVGACTLDSPAGGIGGCFHIPGELCEALGGSYAGDDTTCEKPAQGPSVPYTGSGYLELLSGGLVFIPSDPAWRSEPLLVIGSTAPHGAGDCVRVTGDLYFDCSTEAAVSGCLTLESVIACVAGDLDGDGDIDLGDLGILLGAFGLTNAGDTDGDGDTDLADLGTVLSNFGS
jgi:hypothetical protein